MHLNPPPRSANRCIMSQMKVLLIVAADVDGRFPGKVVLACFFHEEWQ